MRWKVIITIPFSAPFITNSIKYSNNGTNMDLE